MKIIKSKFKFIEGKNDCLRISEQTVHTHHCTMRVLHEHCLDKIDIGLEFEESYEYEVYSFSNESNLVVVRSYISGPKEAHFLGVEVNGKSRPLKLQDFQNPLIKGAVEHLNKLGKSKLNWFDRSNTYNGYSKVPNTD